MSDVKYDLVQLKRFGEINVENALKNFVTQKEFFKQLTEFEENSAEYLSGYSPNKIFTRSEYRKEFLQELKELREIITSLGMADAVTDLGYLENAAFGEDPLVLERELKEFHNRIAKIADIISNARGSSRQVTSSQQVVKKPLILAVDDMPALLSSIVKILHEHYTVVAVTSAEAALKAVQKQTPELFILDIEMPKISGYELAATLRTKRKFADTPIIFLTAKGSRDDVIMAIGHGGTDYIIKPVDKELLLEKIHRYLS